jgi:hypothetical protein
LLRWDPKDGAEHGASLHGREEDKDNEWWLRVEFKFDEDGEVDEGGGFELAALLDLQVVHSMDPHKASALSLA